jgi:death-on-curing family protein
MVFYPTAIEIIEANKIALALTKDKRPHKLRGSALGIQSLIDDIKKSENEGLTYQAARFMRDLVRMHPFDGAQHRTSYLVTLLFLTRNGMRLKNEQPKEVDEFMKDIGAKEIEEIQGWIQQYMVF